MDRKRKWSESGSGIAIGGVAIATSGDDLQTALLKLEATGNYNAVAKEALDVIVGLSNKTFGDESRVLPFGSFIQGIPLNGSDLDLCVGVSCAPDEGDPPMVNGKADNTKQVTILKKLLTAVQRNTAFRIIETRFWKHMKVPIIIMGYSSADHDIEVEVDISVGVQCEGVEKGFTDRVVRRVFAEAPRALHVARVVKLWARTEQLNKAYDGYLNSLGWTLLVIYHFMDKGEVFPGVIHVESPDERGVDGEVTLPPPLHSASGYTSYEAALEDVPSTEDVAEFFTWLGKLSSEWPQNDGALQIWAASLVDASLIQVPVVGKRFPDSASLFIEDPGIRVEKGESENVARSLKAGAWRTTLDKCASAAKILKSGGRAATFWIQKLQSQAPAPKKEAETGEWNPEAVMQMAAKFMSQMQNKKPAQFMSQMQNKKPKLGVCEWWLKGECWSGDNCKYKHEQ